MLATSRQRALLFVSLAAVLAASAARAQELRVEGSWRLRFSDNTDQTLDDTGTKLGQGSWFEHRIRLTPKVVADDVWEVQASADVLSGTLGGDLARDFSGLGWTGRSIQDGYKASSFDLRTIYGTVKFPFGQLQFGQRPSQWGMGLVANSGNDETNLDFGDARFGDLVDGVLFATKPLVPLMGPQSDFARQVVTAFAFDAVYRDRFASLVVRDSNGLHWQDLAWQGVAAALWDPSDKTRIGFYTARRVQSFGNDGGNLHIWVFDLHARHAMVFEGINSTLSLEGEGAFINGATSHLTNLNALSSTKVQQSGAAGRARLAMPLGIEAEVESGFASGDGNPFDGNAANFTSSRDYKVGLVLFDEVLQFQTQNAARRLSDPNLVGRPPSGIDLLPTEGALTNVIYLKPTIRWRPALLENKLRVTGSLLYAVAPEPYVDAYQSFVASAARNPFGAEAKNGYGTELDAAVSYNDKFGRLGVEAGAQYGVLFPGDAFNRADGTSMPKVAVFKLRAGVSF